MLKKFGSLDNADVYGIVKEKAKSYIPIRNRVKRCRELNALQNGKCEKKHLSYSYAAASLQGWR